MFHLFPYSLPIIGYKYFSANLADQLTVWYVTTGVICDGSGLVSVAFPFFFPDQKPEVLAIAPRRCEADSILISTGSVQ